MNRDVAELRHPCDKVATTAGYARVMTSPRTASLTGRRRGIALGLVASVVLTGCAAAPAVETDKTAKPTASAPAPTASAVVATVPGYDVGQFPPIP